MAWVLVAIVLALLWGPAVALWLASYLAYDDAVIAFFARLMEVSDTPEVMVAVAFAAPVSGLVVGLVVTLLRAVSGIPLLVMWLGAGLFVVQYAITAVLLMP